MKMVNALIIDCSGVRDIGDFWDRYERSVGLEKCGCFGRNLDALWDALESGGPGSPNASHVIFTNLDELEVSNNNFFQSLNKLFAEVSRLKAETF